MLRFLQLVGVLLFLSIFLGTGHILVTQGGFQYIWQMFWLGFVIWMWGMTILIRLKDREKIQENYRTKDALFYEQQYKLERLKIAAMSALIAVTFFYSSISWFFQDNLIVSILILIGTFLVSYGVQNKILGRITEEE